MKPIVKYPGAKWRCAEWIIQHLPPHTHYVEPFFGSGAVFFSKTPVRHEVINDLSGDVVNLFRVIREDGERLAALIAMTPWAREEYDLSNTPAADPIEQARRFLVCAWQSYGRGIIGAKTGWRTGGTAPDAARSTTELWASIPDRIHTTAERLLYAEIEHRPALDVLSRHAAGDVLVYADPPYPRALRRDGFYPTDMTDAEHLALLDALDAHPGPVVLSGYHCALYDDRLAHWHTREKRVIVERGQARTEVLWLNPVCVERLGYGALWAAFS